MILDDPTPTFYGKFFDNFFTGFFGGFLYGGFFMVDFFD